MGRGSEPHATHFADDCLHVQKLSKQNFDKWSILCGSSSVVEHHLAMVGVAGSNPVFRFHYFAGVAELADAQDLKSCGK